jgi:hypothetical protein
MVTFVVFLKAFGFYCFLILIGSVFFYWGKVMAKKVCPNFRFWFKYNVLRRKHDKEIINSLIDDIEKGITEQELLTKLMLNNSVTIKKVNETIYNYKELTKLKKQKGGKVKNE